MDALVIERISFPGWCSDEFVRRENGSASRGNRAFAGYWTSAGSDLADTTLGLGVLRSKPTTCLFPSSLFSLSEAVFLCFLLWELGFGTHLTRLCEVMGIVNSHRIPLLQSSLRTTWLVLENLESVACV